VHVGPSAQVNEVQARQGDRDVSAPDGREKRHRLGAAWPTARPGGVLNKSMHERGTEWQLTRL
jgi:hypothetical protein